MVVHHAFTEPHYAEQEKRDGQFDALESDDISRAISFAISCPNNVGVNEITIRPQGQPN